MQTGPDYAIFMEEMRRVCEIGARAALERCGYTKRLDDMGAVMVLSIRVEVAKESSDADR